MLERREPALYDAVLAICEHVFDHPEQAQWRSRAIKTEEGIRQRCCPWFLAVQGLLTRRRYA